MATLYPEVERLRVARDRLVRLRTKVEISPPAPEDLPRSREWVARESLAHIDEMLPFWLGEVERILAAPVEPVPYGRAPSDLIRLLTVDRDRSLPVSELYARLDFHLERVVRRLLELDDRQCARRGLHKTRGDLTIKQIVGENLAGHIEEHCAQMAASLES
jgi:AAA+ ATPase superfamily predicted ATPase